MAHTGSWVGRPVCYLGHREHRQGREVGVKDRPCAIVAVVEDVDGEWLVTVLTRTHTPPVQPENAVELPMATKRRLGMDGERSWIVLTEGNEFVWPGPDLRPLPGQGAASVALGFLPPGFFRTVRDRLLVLARQRRSTKVLRT